MRSSITCLWEGHSPCKLQRIVVLGFICICPGSGWCNLLSSGVPINTASYSQADTQSSPRVIHARQADSSLIDPRSQPSPISAQFDTAKRGASSCGGAKAPTAVIY
ncbi:hypothetical protein BD414DRAFT_255450 [Trametes punicea]|nr:hypothetical protein BD414DRAFT_255450 [Trametes punicea]